MAQVKEWGTAEELLKALRQADLGIPSVQMLYLWQQRKIIQFTSRKTKPHGRGRPRALYPIREIVRQVQAIRAKAEEGQQLVQIAKEAREDLRQESQEKFSAALQELPAVLARSAKPRLEDYVQGVHGLLVAWLAGLTKNIESASTALEGGSPRAARWFMEQIQEDVEAGRWAIDYLADAKQKFRQATKALQKLRGSDASAVVAAIQNEMAQYETSARKLEEFNKLLGAGIPPQVIRRVEEFTALVDAGATPEVALDQVLRGGQGESPVKPLLRKKKTK